MSLLVPATMTFVLTGFIRRYALRNAILDNPNERSSHTVPTPRGGGVAVAITLLASVITLNHEGHLRFEIMVAFFGGVPIACIGWLDDRRSVTPQARATVHVLSACWALYWLGGFPTLHLGAAQVQLGLLGSVLAVLGIVWATNLFNFMDGIDGISGGEALTVGLAGAALLWWKGDIGLSLLALATAGSALGFLWWNWPPARIFLGDVGSGLFGYWFAVMAVSSERSGALPVTLWGILASVFILDATATLLRRAVRRRPLHLAHRSHAYQRLVAARWGHRRVTVSVIAVNAGLALVAAVAVALPSLELAMLGVAYVFLLMLYWLIERRAPMQ